MAQRQPARQALAKILNFRKRIFQLDKAKGKTISPTSQMYDVREDYNKLKEKDKNNLNGGVKLYKEPIISFKTDEEQLEVLETFKKQVKEQGFAFLPIFESENFIQGLMFRPSDDTQIDKAWNRIFYAKHCVNLFKEGYDPTLAGFPDILYDTRSGLFCNWDSRHRIVGTMATSGDQLPKFGWNNALVIKSTAPTKGQKPIFADQVACYLFEQKNDTPKPLSPVERFVAEYRTKQENALRSYTTFKMARLKLGTDVLPDLENAQDARTLTGVSQFRNDYLHDNVGNGMHVAEATRSLRSVWSGAQAPNFSVFLVLGYCHLLQMDNTYNGAWGYDNQIMIDAMKWAYQNKKLEASNYCSPRANGKPYESIAFHFIRLAYNPYCELVLKDETKKLSFKHFGFDDAYLSTIGESKKSLKDTDDEEDVNSSNSLSKEFNVAL